jgi:sigma-70-like protein
MAEEQRRPAQAGAFEQVVLPQLDAAYNLARWLVRNTHDAEDVVQEAYLRAFKFFAGYQGGDARAWVLKIVRNIHFWRRIVPQIWPRNLTKRFTRLTRLGPGRSERKRCSCNWPKAACCTRRWKNCP